MRKNGADPELFKVLTDTPQTNSNKESIPAIDEVMSQIFSTLKTNLGRDLDIASLQLLIQFIEGGALGPVAHEKELTDYIQSFIEAAAATNSNFVLQGQSREKNESEKKIFSTLSKFMTDPIVVTDSLS